MSFQVDPSDFVTSDTAQRITRLERALGRERQARLKAEAIAEQGLRDSYLARSRLELLNSVASVANESNDPRATLQSAVREVCLATGWAIGTVLLRSGDTGNERLCGTDLWFAHDPDLLFAFAESSQKLIAWPSAAAPGQLFIDRQPIYTPDIHALSGFTRSEIAARAHLRSAVTVPVMIGRELVGAMEFFTADSITPDPELLDLLVQIGLQAGRVIKRERHARQLIQSATRDALTGLPNRTFFDLQLQELFDESRLAGEIKTSLIYIDLDGFKLVNDTMGHQAGDQLLVAMTGNLNALTEETAERYPDAKVVLARMGGDEFTIMVNAQNHRQIAIDVAAKIHRCFQSNYCINSVDIRASASVGIAHDDGSYETPEALMRDADLAMYQAKYQGKIDGEAQTVTFDSAMRAEALVRLEIETALRVALEEQHFELHYQPIVTLNNAEMVGFEALLRWTRPDEKPTSPDIFIPVAEECGLIIPIGTWVLREACRTAARWRAIDEVNNSFFISINVAAAQLQQPNFCNLVRDILVETGAHASNLAIELTESTAVLNPAQTGRVLEELRSMGFRISIR